MVLQEIQLSNVTPAAVSLNSAATAWTPTSAATAWTPTSAATAWTQTRTTTPATATAWPPTSAGTAWPLTRTTTPATATAWPPPRKLQRQHGIHGNEKEMLIKAELIDRNVLSSSLQVDQDFFVPAHPVFMVFVPYGLFLTFSSYVCPVCLPAFLPLAPLATFLGLNFNFLMGMISSVAAALHVGEAIQAFFMSSAYNLSWRTTLLWTANTFAFGIFGFWPLAFVDYFYSVMDSYCEFPGSSCYNA